MKQAVSNLIFPKPKSCAFGEGYVVIGEEGESKCCLLIDQSLTNMEQESVNLLVGKISEKIGVVPEFTTTGKSSCNDAVTIKIRTLKDSTNNNLSTGQINEGYCLEITKNGVDICGVDEKGMFYAVQTLIQLLHMDGNLLTLPFAKIKDWPDLKYRGLFVEDRYGPDIMSLQDWKNTIDYMASLKLNFLGVGIYGCWSIQYDNRISEYWYLPIDKYPEIKTPSTIRYYSPLKGGWETVNYLPGMFGGDFFCELIAYGKTKNVIVRPHFNSLGHNTLIPRLYAETSAKDSEGKPTGYSFCMSNEKTYEILFNIYDEIIDKYLKPNDIDWFHMGLDEVLKMSGIDPENPFKEFDPWCQCDRCSCHTHEKLFLEHIIRLSKYLKSKGMKNVTMWHDQLLKMSLINENLVKRLNEEGLNELFILNWWDYSEGGLDTTIPQQKIRKFITPMTGYYHWILTSSYLSNIHAMLKLAHSEGAEGSEAYCTFDYSYDRNYHYFSQYSWNSTGACDVEVFKEDYVKKYYSKEYEKAKRAFEYYDKIAEPGEKQELMFIQLSYYVYTYPKKCIYPNDFPGEAFIKLYEDMEKSKILLKEIYEDSSRAYELFDELSETMQFNQTLLERYKVECLHYKTLSYEYLTLIEINDKCNNPDFLPDDEKEIPLVIDAVIKEIRSLRINREKLMLAVEKAKDMYLIPSELRNLSIHRQFLIDLELHLNLICVKAMKGTTPLVPLIDLQNTRNIGNKMFSLLR